MKKVIYLFTVTILTFVTSMALNGCGGGAGGAGESSDTASNGSSTTSGTTGTHTASSATIQKGWYIRLEVESDRLKDTGTVFGYLEGASDMKDKYDNASLASGGLYTAIYHSDFDSDKEYRSDFRSYVEPGTRSDKWIIRVHSGDKNANIRMWWKGIVNVERSGTGAFKESLDSQSDIFNKMRLIDVNTGNVIPVTGNGDEITFDMNGTSVREFQWILMKDGSSEPAIN